MRINEGRELYGEWNLLRAFNRLSNTTIPLQLRSGDLRIIRKTSPPPIQYNVYASRSRTVETWDPKTLLVVGGGGGGRRNNHAHGPGYRLIVNFQHAEWVPQT